MHTLTLKGRLKQLSDIKKHYLMEHGQNTTGAEMIPNVSILERSPDPCELCLLEALIIKEHDPIANVQINVSNRTVKILN